MTMYPGVTHNNGREIYTCTWLYIIVLCISIDAKVVRRPDVGGISLSQRPWRACSRPCRAGCRFSELALVFGCVVMMLVFTRKCVCSERYTVISWFHISVDRRDYWIRNEVRRGPGCIVLCGLAGALAA